MIDIKLIRIVTGEEIIAEVLDWTGGMITIQNALVVLPSAQQVGFAPWATVISKENPEITLDMKHVIYVAEIDHSVAKKYNQMFGSPLITPDEKKLIV